MHAPPLPSDHTATAPWPGPPTARFMFVRPFCYHFVCRFVCAVLISPFCPFSSGFVQVLLRVPFPALFLLACRIWVSRLFVIAVHLQLGGLFFRSNSPTGCWAFSGPFFLFLLRVCSVFGQQCHTICTIHHPGQMCHHRLGRHGDRLAANRSDKTKITSDSPIERDVQWQQSVGRRSQIHTHIHTDSQSTETRKEG